jgi:hypothetical protein
MLIYLLSAIALILTYLAGHRIGYQKGWADYRNRFAANSQKVRGTGQ